MLTLQIPHLQAIPGLGALALFSQLLAVAAPTRFGGNSLSNALTIQLRPQQPILLPLAQLGRTRNHSCSWAIEFFSVSTNPFNSYVDLGSLSRYLSGILLCLHDSTFVHSKERDPRVCLHIEFYLTHVYTRHDTSCPMSLLAAAANILSSQFHIHKT